VPKSRNEKESCTKREKEPFMDEEGAAAVVAVEPHQFTLWGPFVLKEDRPSKQSSVPGGKKGKCQAL